MIRRREVLVGGGAIGMLGLGPARGAGGDPRVRTRAGLVRGRSADGVLAFTAIPFGQSTAGAARFKPPVPASPWTREFDATRPAATPPQDGDPALPPVTAISEDCLQLNVWAPDAPGPHPVLVWVFGGGNATGACSLPAYQGEAFARDGVVCVSFNYRLGVFGFLELGAILGAEGAGSGNNALRDQLLALNWVRENIAAFGGDPARVTLGGQSAGAWNIAALMASPAARGLFHQAILASGGGGMAYAPAQAQAFARLFMDRLGGVERLQAPIADLLDAQRAAQAEFEDLIPFRPVIDGALLTDRPIERLRAGVAAHVPILLGHTHDEYRYFLSPDQAAGPIVQKMLLSSRVSALPPVVAAYEKAFPRLSAGARTLRLLSADAIAIPTLRIAEAQAAAGGRVYHYLLDAPVSGGPFGEQTPHGMDVPLIFERLDTDFARRVFGYDAHAQAAARQAHGAWVSFVRTGRMDGELAAWPPFDLATRVSFRLGRRPGPLADIEATERRIWEGVI